jgi:hypothetical protein
METCEVTFIETQPCSSSVFECAGDKEVGKKIFEDAEYDVGEEDGDDGEAPAAHVPSTSTTTTTVQDGRSPTPTTIQQDQVEAAAEGEVVSKREAPRSRNVCHFAHSTFVATFEPKDIGHALSDPNWVRNA